MTQNNGGLNCTLGSWALAAAAGLLVIILLLVLGDQRFMAAIFLGGVVFAALGLLFTWIFCRELPKPAMGGDAPAPSVAAPEAPGPANPAPAPAPAAAAPAPAPAPTPAPAAAPDTAETASAEPLVKSSTTLAGEAELAERKGTWRYDAGPAQAEAPAPAAPEGPGTKPTTLDGPRDGAADDLKLIKGVGPKLEQLCNTLGFYHFDQIASWTADEVAWVDQNLEGFKGRVSRDDWVAQAKILAEGGETEFSKRTGGA